MMTWAENRRKQVGELNMLRARTVYQKKGEVLVGTYASVSDAVRLTGIRQGNISTVLHGRRKRAGGYHWSYENPELLPK